VEMHDMRLNRCPLYTYVVVVAPIMEEYDMYRRTIRSFFISSLFGEGVSNLSGVLMSC